MKDRYIAVVIILLILLVSVVGLSLMTRNIAGSMNKKAEEELFASSCSELMERDVTIYWIGSFPDELSPISGKVIRVDSVSEETMPVKSPEFHTIERDPDGNIVRERIPVEYAANLYIVINRAILSEEQYSVIRDCVKDNGVKTVVIGRSAIKSYRDFLMLPVMSYTEDDNMVYSLDGGSVSHALGEGSTPSGIVDYLLKDIGDITEDGDRPEQDITDNSQG
ncbi:hypothetical protein SAMN02910456_00506 [Ruminococcaceae bacterium YRB3002]|nr:hypothetical protein SAMN02910456_00506 [Ruminococcaceae bacterium YRB3002]